MLAKDIMTRTIISVTPDHSVRHAAEIMLENHVSGLPVIDGAGKLVGMLTEGDLLRRSELGTAAEWGRSPDMGEDYIKTHSWCVGDVMTNHAVTIDEAAPIGRLAALMSANDIKRLPVLRDGAVVGIVSRADILRGIAAAERAEGAQGDEAIRRAVLSRLKDDLKLDPALAGASVVDGNIHLWGQVQTETERKAAQLAAETVAGARGVVNGLRLAGDAETQSRIAS